MDNYQKPSKEQARSGGRKLRPTLVCIVLFSVLMALRYELTTIWARATVASIAALILGAGILASTKHVPTKDPMEPKLDKSISKDQIFFLILAILVGIITGFAAFHFLWSGSRFGTEAIVCGVLGAFLGSFSFGRRGNLPTLIYGALLTILALAILFSLVDLPSARPMITFFLSSWGAAFAVISCYHSWTVCKND